MYIIGGAHDYFQEAIDILQNGEHQFTFSCPLNLRGKELRLETEEGSFGREDEEVEVDAFEINIQGTFYQQGGHEALLMSGSYRQLSCQQL